MQKEIKKLI